MTTIRIASTLARTGRSMKNFEIMAGPSASLGGLRRLGLRIDLVARDGAQEPADDHAVVRRDALLDHTQGLDHRADLDLALLDHVLLVDDQHVAAALVAAEGDVRHQEGVLLLPERQ